MWHEPIRVTLCILCIAHAHEGGALIRFWSNSTGSCNNRDDFLAQRNTSKSEVERVRHLRINNIRLTSLYLMAKRGSGDQIENGSFQNQMLPVSTSGLELCRKALSCIWVPRKRKKVPRGNPT